MGFIKQKWGALVLAACAPAFTWAANYDLVIHGGRVLDPEAAEARRAVELLAGRYPQHRREPPKGAVLAVDVTRWSGWAADQSSRGSSSE